jgi:uncharacterized protein YjbI with pentapeptide repeats
MKKLILILALIPFWGLFAQKTMSSKEVFEMIDKGQAVNLQDVVIEGDLDLTELSNKRRNKKNSDESYVSNVTASISFKKCVFKGDFIAYKHVDRKTGKNFGGITINWEGNGITHTADFYSGVTFDDCEFKGASEFKYSSFKEGAKFSASGFSQDANFKYASFDENAYFDGCDFDKYASFKYTNFEKDADFYNVVFDGTADFKYTNFDMRSTFKNTTFNAFADFKYANFDESRNFNNTQFKGGSDFKYSKK